MDALLERIKQLPDEKRREFVAAVKRDATFSILPLSYAQFRMWFQYRINPQSPFYNIPVAVSMQGTLQQRALELALNEIVKRHEILRTQFIDIDGEPLQKIRPHSGRKLVCIDLRQLRVEQVQEKLEQLRRSEAQRPFDLSNDELFRTTLIQSSDDSYTLLMTVHHIVADGWSMGILTHELGCFYSYFLANSSASKNCDYLSCDYLSPATPPLPPLPIQYADFTRWQYHSLTQQSINDDLQYWLEQLAELPPLLQLPLDYPRPNVQHHKGKTLTFFIEQPLTDKLKTLAQQQQCSLFMTLLAAFQLLMHRYTGQDDIVVGSPIANRRRPELEGLIGMFVNTLVLRTRFNDNPSVTELLARVRNTTLDAYSHQDVPFERLVEALQPERDIRYCPLVQVMFIFQNSPLQPLQLPGLEVTTLHSDNNTAKLDLLLSMQEEHGGLRAELEYNVELFHPDTAQQLAQHLQRLLQAMVDTTQQRVDHLPLLTPNERQQLVYSDTMHNSAIAAPKGQRACLPQLFEAQVARQPEATALTYGSTQLSYRCLNARANRLAHHLRSLGVGPENLVGVCLQRSPDMVACLLAILKAGAAYVALDPDYPRAHTQHILDDAQPTLLISQLCFQGLLPDSVTRLWLDEENLCQSLQRCSVRNPSPVAATLSNHRAHLAYCIYTSGSTGQPKGVLIDHQNLSALLDWAKPLITDCDGSIGMLAATSLCFDPSVFELFVPLAWGGRVVLTRHIMDIAQGSDIGLISVVSSAARELVKLKAIPDSVHTVFLVGEPVPRGLAKAITSASRVQRVYNLYGPTETTIYASAALLPADDAPVSVGRAITPARIHILDKTLQPVPARVIGEIYIGGEIVGRGYLRRPMLTAQRFIPDPFADKPGPRLYRTGDLGRYRRDGTIEVLGRIDHQVKVRGFRIELEEIDSVLATHPSIERAVTKVFHISDSDIRLISYYLGQETSETQLQAFCAQRLPKHMLPARFIYLQTLPRTANGKINHSALPAPDFFQAGESEHTDHRTGDPSDDKPRNPAEATLLNLYQQLLKVEQVSIFDSFFELGGHSLLAMQLLSEIRKHFDKTLALSQIFTAPSIAQLAVVLTQTPGTEECARRGNAAGDVILAPLLINKRHRDVNGELRDINEQRPPLFCIHPAGGQVHCYQPLAESLGLSRPVIGVQSRTLQTNVGEYPSIHAMANAYANAIETYGRGPYRLLGWSLGGVIAVDVAHALETRGHTVTSLTLLDSQALTLQNRQEILDPLLSLSLVFGANFTEHFSRLAAEQQHDIAQSLRLMPTEQRLQHSIEIAQRRGWLPDEIEFDSLQQQLKLTDTHVKLLAAHTPAPVNCDIHCIWASETLREAVTNVSTETQLSAQWQRFTNGRLHSTTLEGNHFSLLSAPCVQQLANTINEFSS